MIHLYTYVFFSVVAAILLLEICLFYWVWFRTKPHEERPVLNLPGLLSDERASFSTVANLADDELYQRILSYFETDRPYLKAGVNVADIAAVLCTNKTYVSRLLNDKLNQNFPQFINAYRIKEAQRLVVEEGVMPLQTLCKRVGFTSMASFTVAFKVNTGMTPGEWCRKQKQTH
ncbi:MAG: AraC family transcriptional regulator [Bacteroidetes bacterium]|nr:AraC family transcriptional regulator [Bacteroidota bacterium]